VEFYLRSETKKVDYSSWKYLYPPRPEHVITSDLLPLYESRNWVGQYKKNGTCVTITIDPKGSLLVCDRYGNKLKSWQCPPWLGLFILNNVPNKRWTMLVAELLHSKTPTIKDTLYLRDVIVYQNIHLIGTTFNERQHILGGLFSERIKEEYSHWEITSNIWLAKNFDSNFAEKFKKIKDPRIDEGLVLIKPDAKLKWCLKEGSNSMSVKCRYPTKNYQF